MAAYLMSVDPGDGYSDSEGMQRYAETVRGIVESFGGDYLVRHRETRTLEGDWAPGHIVLIQFPSMSRLREFYESDAYRPWLELRQRAGRTSIVVTES
ncbi:MAG: hypothetical protein QOF99_705 [Pseudonocardiales bacterium]|nr:hypothetical protein [Pseudonocardiales bacterium]